MTHPSAGNGRGNFFSDFNFCDKRKNSYKKDHDYI